MSASATPITPARFAAALPELPLANLHAKGAELRNSIAHLRISNAELRGFADDGDADCQQAIDENDGVIASMEERIDLLRREVEARGYRWDHGEARGSVEVDGGGGGDVEMVDGDGGLASEEVATNGRAGGRAGGGLGDEELARRLRERLEGDEEDGAGLHL